MSANEIRAAAKVLRDRATAATRGPWNPATTGVESGDHWYVLDLPTMHAVCWIRADDGDNEAQRPRDAAYIATMHPGVGFAMADWLDLTARDLKVGLVLPGDCHKVLALAVARLILGGES